MAKRLKCAALATGMKCLPQAKVNIALQGNVIHDSHAEILALRAFNRFLLEQCADLAKKGRQYAHDSNHVLEWTPSLHDPDLTTQDSTSGAPGNPTTKSNLISASRGPTLIDAPFWSEQPFRINPAIKLHMYCSEAPCGDASMELTMASQEDATPWTRTPPRESRLGSSETSADISADAHITPHHHDSLYGRSYFDVLGVVRRKPSRPDAPPTLSKSCSDKLALRQCTSTLSTMTSLLIQPDNAYLHTVTLPSSQYVEKACHRAFGPHGRMAAISQPGQSALSDGGYRYRPFEVRTTTREFKFGRRISPSAAITAIVPSNIASLTFGPNQETLINGVLQGRKHADPKGASSVSRRKMWSLALSIATLVGERAISHSLSRSTYRDMKQQHPLRAREAMKSAARLVALKGWKKNSGDEEWTL